MRSILLVDDEENILKALRRVLGAGRRFTVETFSDPRQALVRAEEAAFDLVISDYRMPGMDGVGFLKAFRKIQPDAARLILSGYADWDGLIGAINEAEILRFIAKPWHDADLLATIGQALAYRDLLLENRRLADEVRAQRGIISKQEMELRRLEEESPGITKVNWGPDGSVMIDEE